MGYARYVAIGDSQTEGIGDPDGDGGWRGFADRLADRLAASTPGLHYANLAVRGKLARQVREEQLDAALTLRPDLVTVVAGMNDLIRPSFSAEAVVSELDGMFAELTAAGARVASLTFPDLTRLSPLLRPLRHRVLDLNAGIRTSAARHGVMLVETFGYSVITDPRLWSPDRLHASPLGHARLAAAFAEVLALPDSDNAWTKPLPGARRPTAVRTVAKEVRWLTSFAVPWLYRRLRRRSTGEHLTPKRPTLVPVNPPASEPA
ncbi:SGNH/GDSL hydrolase family protein [Saccharomonospora glauca]|jgi:lysophospholipase L1-like esterase|uniref:Lysophospholipase L1-like esterase n=1 Tax=Saccharomonospora glauca K62 TaxID=928724 RepID=I1CXP0_9PSEU|nr:SGNH/GDSL hydrolase family protein [Saccharomonospora glauca]EIE97464.1 lysophospholipase L1-like esterase [Saccharomonospora glauca K62]